MLAWDYHWPKGARVAARPPAPEEGVVSAMCSRLESCFGMLVEGSLTVLPSALITLPNRRTCKAKYLRKGCAVLGYNIETSSITVTSVRSVSSGFRWLFPQSFVRIHLRDRQFQPVALLVAEDQMLWRVRDGATGWGVARHAEERLRLAPGDCLIQRDGSACVVVEISADTPSDEQEAWKTLHLE
eukprot:5670830-Amphidinium_carterae.1